MKFGIYSSIADPPAGENLALRVDEVVAEAKLAESVGFDSCFFGEHHQDKDGFLPSPLIVSAAVAAQTTTLNLGTSVILLPLAPSGTPGGGRDHPGHRFQGTVHPGRGAGLSAGGLSHL